LQNTPVKIRRMNEFTLKWAAGANCVLLIALCGCSLSGQQQDLPSQRDFFIYGVALEFKDPALCQKIPPYVAGGGSDWSTPPGYQISYLQSRCYYNLAGATHVLSLCDHVRPLSTGSFDGSKYNPEDCRLHSPAAPEIGGVDPHTVVEWMRKLGYRDEDVVHEPQYRANRKNPVTDAYDRLRRDSLFAERIEAAPTFDEPFAAAKMRPANDLEYVYQMFAVDSNQAIFCDKISPNAQAEWRDKRRFFLRLACYRSTAVNNRDLSVCERLPTRSTLPPGATDYDSRASCRRNVEVVMRPDGGHYTNGPEFPPTFSSFHNGLRDLGYDLTFPELTSRDYEDFLLYLSGRQADPAARAEFLRRVAAME
jgi:hypothetical protein